jgi:hypothetical protein
MVWKRGCIPTEERVDGWIGMLVPYTDTLGMVNETVVVRVGMAVGR